MAELLSSAPAGITPTGKVLVVAERWNWPRRERCDQRVDAEQWRDWWRASVAMGAFHGGGPSRGRLARMGIDLDEVIDGVSTFDACNLLPPVACAGAWDAQLASRVVREWSALGVFESYQGIIAVGQRAARALCGQRVSPLVPHGDVLLVPHPSGQNRWWNDPHAAALARVVVMDFIEGVRARSVT